MRILPAVVLLAIIACNESTPKIINTGSSRGFDFSKFFASPPNAAIFAVADSSTSSQVISQGVERSNLITQVQATDSTNELFKFSNCEQLSSLNRRVANWGWIGDPSLLSKENTFGIYLAEKSYLRFFSNYCLSYENFFNSQIEEKTSSSATYGTINYLQSDTLSITDGAQSATYNFLLSETGVVNNVKHLLYSLHQTSGATDSNFYERLTYTYNTSEDIKRYSTMRMLADRNYDGGKSLPSFFHLESYTLDRYLIDSNSNDQYDLLSYRISRLDRLSTDEDITNRQILFNGKIISHPSFGTYIVESNSCVKDKVTAIGALLNECPDTSDDGLIISNSGAMKVYSKDGKGFATEAAFSSVYPSYLALLKKYLEELEDIELQWYKFGNDTTTATFQTTDPAKF